MVVCAADAVIVIAVSRLSEAIRRQHRAVGSLPPEPRVRKRGEPAPDQRGLDAESRKDAWQLRAVAEQVADEARVRWLATPFPNQFAAVTDVADKALAAHQKLIRQNKPRPRDQASFGQKRAHGFPPLRPDFQVVAQDDCLTISGERPSQGAGLKVVKDLVQQPHQAEAVLLECLIPFPIPVGTRDVVGVTKWFHLLVWNRKESVNCECA